MVGGGRSRVGVKTCGYMKIVEVSSSMANTIPKLIHRIIGASGPQMFNE